VRSSWQKREEETTTKERRALDELEEGTEEYDTKKTSNIKNILLDSSLRYFIADRIKRAMENHVVELGLVSSVCISFCITVVIYATCYYGLAWISSEHFTNIGSYWDFIYVSFGALVHNSIPGFSPKSTVAQLLFLSEQVCGGLLFVILLFFLVTVMRESLRCSLNSVIADLESDYQYYRSQLLEHYGLEIAEAMKLIKAKTESGDKVRMFIIHNMRPTIEPDK
jgi:hypothetical protein